MSFKSFSQQIDRNIKQQEDVVFDLKGENDNLEIKNVLLRRCKSVISELHVKIADLNDQNAKLNQKIIQLGSSSEQQGRSLRQNTYNDNDDVDQVEMLSYANIELEQRINKYIQNEQILTFQLEELTQTNSEMDLQFKQLEEEIHKRDQIAQEWDEHMMSINIKVMELDKQNQELILERNQFFQILEKISPLLVSDSIENLNVIQNSQFISKQNHNLLNKWLQQAVDNLQNAIEDNENKNQLIEQLNQDILNLNNNNLILQQTLQNNQNISPSQKQHNSNIIENIQDNKDMENIKKYIQDLKQQISQANQEYQEKTIENQRLKAENIKLKDKINLLNRKYLDVRIENTKLDCNINNEQNQIRNNQNEEVFKYKELIQEQKSIISLLQKNDQFINQAKELTKLQQINELLSQKMLECKYELNQIQQDLLSQYEKDDQRNIQTQENIKQLGQLICERDEIIKSQNKEILSMKVIISQKSLTSNGSNLKTNETKQLYLEETFSNQENIQNNKSLHYLLNDNKILQQFNDDLQNQLNHERQIKLKEQEAIKQMKQEIQNLELQYNREVNFYKSEYKRLTNSTNNQLNPFIEDPSNNQNKFLINMRSYTEGYLEDINKEKKSKITKKKQVAHIVLKDNIAEVNTQVRSKSIGSKQKKKKKQEQTQNTIAPSIKLCQQNENIITKKFRERASSCHNNRNPEKQQVNNQIKVHKLDQGQVVKHSQQSHYDSTYLREINQQTNQIHELMKNKPFKNQYQNNYQSLQLKNKTIQQPTDQIVDKFKQVIENIENKLGRMNADINPNHIQPKDEYKPIHYNQTNH